MKRPAVWIGAATLGLALAIAAFGWHMPMPPAPFGSEGGGEGSQSGGDEDESDACTATTGPATAPLSPEPRNNDVDQCMFIDRTITLDEGFAATDSISWNSYGGGDQVGGLRTAAPNQARGPFDPVLFILDTGNLLAIANPLTGAFDATINLAQGLPAPLTSPQRMALTPDGRRIVVTNLGHTLDGAVTPPHITFVDVAARRIEDRLMLPDGLGVWDVAASADSAIAYVGAAERTEQPPFFADPRVLVIDIDSRQIVAEIPLPDPAARPGDLAITPDGALLFVVGGVERARGRIFAIDTRTRTLSSTITPVEPVIAGNFILNQNSRLAMHPDGSRLYVAPLREFGGRGNAVGTLNTSTLAFESMIEVGEVANPARAALAITDNGRDLYFNDPLGQRLLRIDTITNRILQERPIGPGSFGPIYTFSVPRGTFAGL